MASDDQPKPEPAPEKLEAPDKEAVAAAESEGMTHADMTLGSAEPAPQTQAAEPAGAASQALPATPEPPETQPPDEPAPQPDSSPPVPLSPAQDFLEETVLPSTVENLDLKPGSLQQWGGFTFTAGQAALPGWYHGTQGETGLLVKPGLDGALLAGLGAHKMLPKLAYAGPEGVAVVVEEGEVVREPVELAEALEALQPLAQLVFFLERKGLTLVDLEPLSLLKTGSGLKLIPPPRLGRVGEKATPLWHEGYTPPEVLAEATLSPKTGVYLLGALLFDLLSGVALPAEGPSEILLGGLKYGGVPQILKQFLAPLDERPSPQAALALLKALAAPPDPVIELAAATNVGLNPTRPLNEDSYSYRIERVGAQFNSTSLIRACVSDGMGGMAAGERASQAAVEAFVSGSIPSPLDDPTAQSDWGVRLVWEGNAGVLKALEGRDGGCTMTGVILLGPRYTLAHVGDTRAYLWDGRLTQLTRDHSLVAMLVQNGVITPQEADHHPDRNKVLRSLGGVRQVQPNWVDTLENSRGVVSSTLEPGQMLVLVSDGVWGEVDEPVMARIIETSPDIQTICDRLVQDALDKGAPDNATALVVKRSR
ncbi:MAG: protein phosphatase 2C domain-containing protein [Meiothermus sp.]|nr:protein phosphatase 2C domain-containing protein [Meiothermus sp.]